MVLKIRQNSAFGFEFFAWRLYWSIIFDFEILVRYKRESDKHVRFYNMGDADVTELANVFLSEEVFKSDEHSLVEFDNLTQQIEWRLQNRNMLEFGHTLSLLTIRQNGLK